MNQPAKLARLVIQGAWRRRLFVIATTVCMFGVGVAAAKFLPKSYFATSLLLLQESNKDSVFQTQSAASHERIQERAGGLQALLKSDHVLTRSLRDIRDQDTTSSGEFDAQLAGLRKNISLDLAGTDFLEIRLKGSRRDGLGRQLTIITTRFLEALLPDQRGLTALQLLADERRSDVARAEARVERLRADFREAYPDSDSSIQMSRTGASTASARAPPQTDVVRDDRAEPGNSGPNPGRQAAERSLVAAEQALVDAREQQAIFTKRYGVRARSSSILSAPERILIVDTARDPTGPSIPDIAFVAAGLLAGIILAVTLTTVAELMSPVLRYVDDFATIAGVPVLARIPYRAYSPTREVGT